MITKCLDNRPYSGCPPSLPPVGIDGIKAMSRGISGTEIKSRSSLFILWKWEDIYFSLTKCTVRVSTSFTLLRPAVRTSAESLLHPKRKQWALPPKILHYRLFDKKKNFFVFFFKNKQTRPRFLVLITTENTITYHNALCFCHPKILHKHCLQFLLGVDQQRALWYTMVFSVALN